MWAAILNKLSVFVAAFLALSGPAQAAAIGAGACYGGRLARGNISVSLCLYDGSFFILSQRQEAGGKKRLRDICGTWRADGALLHLANRHGFAQNFNIGANSVLYGDFFSGRIPQTVALKEQPLQKQRFAASGRLTQKNGRFHLDEAASGRIFSAGEGLDGLERLGAEEKNILAGGGTLFAEAWLLPEKGGGQIATLRHVSKKLPGERTAAPGGQNFCAAAVAGRWLAQIPGVGHGFCLFSESPANGESQKGNSKKGRAARKKNAVYPCRGELEIAAPGFRLEAAFEAKGEELAIKIGEKSRENLAKTGQEKFGRDLMAVESWAFISGALVLKGGGIPDIVLENLQSEQF